jgi:geranylgeranyl diphosphate synthase type II
MDHSLLRRNNTTVHKKWDENVAILSGDAMQIYAYKLLCETEMPLLENLLHIYNNTALEVCEGQQYDMNFGKTDKVTIKDYIRMIELKTAVLLAASLKIGAVCANAGEEDARNLYEFGRNLGLAFQIQDDYLDIYANQDIFGKITGGDITENKKTFLLIKALDKANSEQAKVLNQKIGNNLSCKEKIEKVKNIFNDLDIPSITRQEINRYSNLAFNFLDLVKVEEQRKCELRLLAKELTERIK